MRANSASPNARVTGTALALTPVVRLTTRPDEHTTIAIRHAAGADANATVTVPATGVDLVAVERSLIRFALEVHDGNRTRAALFLGLSRSALLYRMQKHHLDSRLRHLPDGEPS